MENKLKVVCIGDSSTRWGEVEEENLWPAVLQAELNKVGLDAKVINCGVPGDCTSGMVGRFYPDVVDHQPDYVIIIGGANDMWWNVPPSIPRANIYSMIKQALHHEIIPVLGIFDLQAREALTTYEQYGKAWEPELGLAAFKERRSKLNQSYLDDIVLTCNLLHIDFREAMNGQFCDEAGYPIPKFFCRDGMHLSAEGNRIIAKVAADFLKTLPKHDGILST